MDTTKQEVFVGGQRGSIRFNVEDFPGRKARATIVCDAGKALGFDVHMTGPHANDYDPLVVNFSVTWEWDQRPWESVKNASPD